MYRKVFGSIFPAFLSLLLLFITACGSVMQVTPTSTKSSSFTPTATRGDHPGRVLSPGGGGGTGRIALACASPHTPNNTDICTSNLDGSGLRQLTTAPGTEISPAWSPDGKRIVFRNAPNSNIIEASDIWIMNADGSAKTNLTRDLNSNWGATWSPDGRHILFNSARDGNTPHLYIMNSDGSHLQLLFPKLNLWQEYASWSPDGTKIAFMSNVGASSFVIYVINTDGTGLIQVTRGPGEDGGPRWSPDGKHIAFTSNRSKQAEVYTINAKGAELARLTNSPHDTSSGGPDWSPDGTRLLFLHSLPNGGEIWIMNADGSAQTKLMDAYGFGDAPVWQP